MPDPGGRPTLVELFLSAAAGLDGERLVGDALSATPALAAATHVLCAGKVALPMWRGVQALARPRAALAVLPAPLVPATPPARLRVIGADHPRPSEQSVAAARAAAAFVSGVGPGDRLLVLLSGGSSSLLCAPAVPLSLADKRAAVAAVAAAGATIAELNTVRKHLSAIKGGRLGLHTQAPTQVLALSDVIGDDPSVIGSGPFSADASTFADALAVIDRLGATVPAAARAHLQSGAAGQAEETPKPGDRRLRHVSVAIVAGPDAARAQALHAAQATGFSTGELWQNSEADVEKLATVAVAQARALVAAGREAPRILVGNGEPTIKLTGDGRGGRATHLALLVARGLATLPPELGARVGFLAAGTDDRDGNSDVSGGVVDGTTWQRALDLGLSPQGALDRCDSASILQAVKATVRGPGTSNLLDLHFLTLNLPLGGGRL